jgi:hypothetical protein
LAWMTRSSFHERLPVRRSSSRRATGTATFVAGKPTSVAGTPTSGAPCPSPCLNQSSGHRKPFSMHLRAAWDDGATRAVARWPTRAMPTVEPLKADEPTKLASMASSRRAAPSAPDPCSSHLSHSHLWKSCATAPPSSSTTATPQAKQTRPKTNARRRETNCQRPKVSERQRREAARAVIRGRRKPSRPRTCGCDE